MRSRTRDHLARTGPPSAGTTRFALARAREETGWDRVLTACSSGSPDPAQAAALIACHSEPLQPLLAVAVQGERHDRTLWTVMAQATIGAGNPTALVGTPETAAAAPLDHVRAEVARRATYAAAV